MLTIVVTILACGLVALAIGAGFLCRELRQTNEALDIIFTRLVDNGFLFLTNEDVAPFDGE